MNELEALVPRSLIVPAKGPSFIKANHEGLSHIRLGFESGFIRKLCEVNDSASQPKQLLLPRLIEPHAHLDKVFTWERFPNLKATYEGALEANLKEHQKVLVFQLCH